MKKQEDEIAAKKTTRLEKDIRRLEEELKKVKEDNKKLEADSGKAYKTRRTGLIDRMGDYDDEMN